MDRLADGTASSRLRGSRGCHTGCVPIIWGPYSLVAMLCSERGFGAETPMGWLEAGSPSLLACAQAGGLGRIRHSELVESNGAWGNCLQNFICDLGLTFSGDRREGSFSAEILYCIFLILLTML